MRPGPAGIGFPSPPIANILDRYLIDAANRTRSPRISAMIGYRQEH
jgi:hypothetical protein